MNDDLDERLRVMFSRRRELNRQQINPGTIRTAIQQRPTRRRSDWLLPSLLVAGGGTVAVTIILLLAAVGGNDRISTELPPAEDGPEPPPAEDAPETTVGGGPEPPPAEDAPETTVGGGPEPPPAEDAPETTVGGDDRQVGPTDTPQAPETTEEEPLEPPIILEPHQCDDIVGSVNVLAPNPLLTAEAEATRQRLFDAVLDGDEATLESLFPAESLFISHLASGPTWTEKLAHRGDLGAGVARSLCEGSTVVAGNALFPSWFGKDWEELTEIERSQLRAREAERGLELEGLDADALAMETQVFTIEIDDEGTVTNIFTYLS